MSRTASRWSITLLLFLSVQAFAADPQSTWVYDSAKPSPSPSESSRATTDEEQIYAVILDQLRYWNAHDIEGYMEVYWKSPELLVVVDAEQFNGWQQLHDSYINGYPDRIAPAQCRRELE